MKTPLLIITALMLCLNAFSQTDYYVSAGGTYNVFDKPSEADIDVEMPFGYYASIGLNTKIAEKLGYTGSLLFLNQFAKVEGIKVPVNSIGGAFSLNYYPLGNGLKALAGFNIGLVISDFREQEKAVFGVHGGLGYEIWKLDIIAKYNQIISDNPFNSTIMLGVGYKIF